MYVAETRELLVIYHIPVLALENGLPVQFIILLQGKQMLWIVCISLTNHNWFGGAKARMQLQK